MADKYGSLYNRIVAYQITARCEEPLHIGSNHDRKGGVLIHPVKNIPFIQAAGIAGAFRDFLSGSEDLQKKLFGTQAGDRDRGDDVASWDTGSRVRISDAFFIGNAVGVELRPRVKINPETGTGQRSRIKGAENWSGQKFEMESVSARAEFSFTLYLYEMEHEYEQVIEYILAALHAGMLQLGGQKSNGCGYVTLKTVTKTDYDMTRQEDRKLWTTESKKGQIITEELKKQSTRQDTRIHFELSGEVKDELLIKAIAAREPADVQKAASTEHIRTYDGKLLIPATSIKGVIRSQMEKIAKYKKLPTDFIETVFGKNAAGKEKGHLGCIHFFDVILEGAERKDPHKRIHIDKFTGGVFYSGLFQEKTVYGTLKIRVDLDREDKQAAGILLMALRDMGIGILPLGSGSSIGRGYISGTELIIKKGASPVAKINLRKKQIEQGEEYITELVRAV